MRAFASMAARRASPPSGTGQVSARAEVATAKAALAHQTPHDRIARRYTKGRMVDPIALAVPGFFALIGVETLVARRRGVRVYRLTDSITDLSCGVSSQIEAMFFAATQLAVYALVFARFRVVELHGWQAWLVAFIGVDFFYYWWHRFSHEVNFLWAAHVVHHQSEDYNLAVALRQSITTGWSGLPFYLPL